DYNFDPHIVNTWEGFWTWWDSENDATSHAHGWPNAFYESAAALMGSQPNGAMYIIPNKPLSSFVLKSNVSSNNYAAVAIVVNSLAGEQNFALGSLTVLDADDVPWTVPAIDENFVADYKPLASSSAASSSTNRVGYPQFSVGSDSGGSATVSLYNPDESVAK